ncbi:MAG: hypothetical protein E7375_01285 [Clostridiales bacterium]|nr:hypothetical protein [Clostridiales bacterium]
MALVLVAIFTGVFVAIKSNNSHSLGQLQEISLGDFYSGVAASSSAFFSRTISLLVNVVLIALLSFSVFLFPIAEVLFVYRGYLFGLNFTLIFIMYGMGSIITAIVVILPCQLLTLGVLILGYIILQRLNANCKKFGGSESNRFLFVLLMFLLVVLINLLETLLLFMLNGKVILVI